MRISNRFCFSRQAVTAGERLLSNFAAIGSGLDVELGTQIPIAVFYRHALSLPNFVEDLTAKRAITNFLGQPDKSQ